MNTVNLKLIAEIYQEYEENDLLEDRREYGWEGLRKSVPGLTEDDAKYLERLIQTSFDSEADTLYHSQWTNESAQILAENVTEAIHNDLDGWEDWEKVVIRLFLHDLGIGQKVGQDDLNEKPGNRSNTMETETETVTVTLTRKQVEWLLGSLEITLDCMIGEPPDEIAEVEQIQQALQKAITMTPTPTSTPSPTPT